MLQADVIDQKEGLTMYYEQTFRVEGRDADPFNQCRPSSLLNLLQETAIRHAIELHVSRQEMMERYHCFWMMARLWYRLEKPVYWDDKLTVRTFHRGNKGIAMYRDFDLFRNGEPIGEAVSTWVLADLTDRKLLKLSQVAEVEGTTGGELCKSITLHKIRMPEELEPKENRLLHYSDCDVNGHVNNVRYADFACDAVRLDKEGAGKFVSELQISFLRECRPGETLALSAAREADTWYVKGSDEEGAERFSVSLKLENLL